MGLITNLREKAKRNAEISNLSVENKIHILDILKRFDEVTERNSKERYDIYKTLKVEIEEIKESIKSIDTKMSYILPFLVKSAKANVELVSEQAEKEMKKKIKREVGQIV